MTFICLPQCHDWLTRLSLCTNLTDFNRKKQNTGSTSKINVCVRLCVGRRGGGHLPDMYSRRHHSAAGAGAHKGHSAETTAGCHQTERPDPPLGQNKHTHTPQNHVYYLPFLNLPYTQWRKVTNKSSFLILFFVTPPPPGDHLVLPAHAHADGSLAGQLPDSVWEQ